MWWLKWSIFDNNHEQVIKEEFVISENSDVFIDSDTREIDLYATNWQSLDVDLGDLYAYDDPNLYSCIRYAHLHAKDKLACGPMLNLFKPHKILPKDPDFEKLQSNFTWLPATTVKETIKIQPSDIRQKTDTL